MSGIQLDAAAAASSACLALDQGLGVDGGMRAGCRTWPTARLVHRRMPAMQAGVRSTASQRALVGPPLGLWHHWHRRGGRGLLLRSPWRPPRPAVHLDAARHGWFGDRTHRCAWRPLPLGGSGRAAVPDPQPHCGRDVDLPGVHAWAQAGLSGRYHDRPWLGCLAVHANDPLGSPLGQVCRLPRPPRRPAPARRSLVSGCTSA